MEFLHVENGKDYVFKFFQVFQLRLKSLFTANNSYAILSSYSVSTDSDPCTHTFCKTNSDVCKLRIDFDKMVLSPPATLSATAVGNYIVKVYWNI